MNENSKRQGFGWGYLVLGLFFFASSIVAFLNPGPGLEPIAFLYAFVAIAYGVWLIFKRSSFLRVISGAFNVLIGILLFINGLLALASLPLLFSAWFVLNSLFNLLDAPTAEYTLGRSYMWFSILVNILGVLLGLLLLFSPVAALLTLPIVAGFYLLLISIECVVLAFAQIGKDLEPSLGDYDLGIM
ncbi:DUF308 domain-containing protein [Ruminococcaceae bacterium OttesenSCG-928-I18]|nr:DUF308 domain-containing protein [Ruminococcaceae bacterium OttesenSCG-928-I18]